LHNIVKLPSPAIADFEAGNIFNDSQASLSLNVQVKQHVFAWTGSPKDKYIIIQYTIINQNATLINNIYAGLYLDWDIGNSLTNRIGFDATHRLGYCYSINGGTYTGISLLTTGPLFHYGFDNDGTNGSIKVTGGFTSNEKYSALKTNRNDAGMSSTGNDVSQMESSGPYSIAPSDSIVLAFALIAGDHLIDLQNSVEQAIQNYFQTAVEENSATSRYDIRLYQNEPNPFTGKTSISFYLGKEQNVELSYNDINGNGQTTVFKGKLEKGLHTFEITKALSPGVYIYSLNSDGFSVKKKMCVVQ